MMDKIDKAYLENENLWDQQWPSDGVDKQPHSGAELDSADELTPFPGGVGTSDEIESVRDAQPYTPPIDPPVLPGGRGGIHVSSGFGLSTADLTSDGPIPRGDEDIREEVMRTIQQDSLGSQLLLHVHVENGVVRLVGQVQSMDEADHVASVIDQLPGVVEVIDSTTLEPTGA